MRAFNNTICILFSLAKKDLHILHEQLYRLFTIYNLYIIKFTLHTDTVLFYFCKRLLHLRTKSDRKPSRFTRGRAMARGSCIISSARWIRLRVNGIW